MKSQIAIVSVCFIVLGFVVMVFEWFVLKTQVFQLFSMGIIAVIVGVVLLMYLYIPPFFGKRQAKEIAPLAELKSLLVNGVKYEDEFIETYMSYLRDEGFMLLFGGRQTETRQIMDTLISESKFHKSSLENVITNLVKSKTV